MERSKKKPSLKVIVLFSYIISFLILEFIHLILNETLSISVSHFGTALSMFFLVFCYKVEDYLTRLGILLFSLVLCSVFLWIIGLFIDFPILSWTLYFSLGLFLLVLYVLNLDESELKTTLDAKENNQNPLIHIAKNEQENLEREQFLKEKINEFSDSEKDEYLYFDQRSNKKNNYVKKLEKQINNEQPIEELPVELSNKRLEDLKWLNETGVWNDKNKKRYIKAQITPEEIEKITGRRNTNPNQLWDGTRGFDDWASK